MATGVSKPPSSRLSNFFHDLVTVDFHQTDIKTGVRTAIILIIVTVLGLITGYAAETLVASSIWIAFRRRKSDLPLGRKGE